MATQTQNRLLVFWARYRLVILTTALVAILHYNTAVHIHALHGIYRRLFYFPIILAGFRGGIRGGAITAAAIILLYLPHALGWIGFDPGSAPEKFLEMVLYLAVGLLTGFLVDRIRNAQLTLARTAQELRQTLADKTRMEAELVRSARLAAVGRLSAGLAHEIRNPLASIQGSAEVLADDFPPGHPKAGLLGILLQEAARLNQVLTRFLAFARSEPGEREGFDLRAEAAAVADLLRHRPDAPAVRLTAAGSGPIRAVGNPQQVRQVILNLGLNAVAAAGPQGTITLEVDLADGRARCLVQDDGPGFSQEALENFGTPFYTTGEDGTGLGLATSLRISEDMGGTLAVEPGPDRGARVVLTLPAETSGDGGGDET